MELNEIILYWAEIIGVIAFSGTGALMAIQKRLDVFGVVILGIITALGGGITRDILLGNFPPLMFLNYTYALTALLTAILIFLVSYFKFVKIQNKEEGITWLSTLDAVGLGAFTITGMNVALSTIHGDNQFLVISVGVITGIGGGMIRDIMIGRVPVVLQKQIYAVAAIIGACLYYLLLGTPVDKSISMIICMFVIIIIRLISIHFKLGLPKVK